MLWSCDDLKLLISQRVLKLQSLIFGYVVDHTITGLCIKLYGYLNRFCYELWYISFPINPINLKLTECTHMVVINIPTKFEVIWTK